MKCINFKQLREKLGNRARSTIYLDIERGLLPKPIKLGSKLYWDEAAVEASLASKSSE